jgi:molybdate/tungstate transport system substrate-binding protein
MLLASATGCGPRERVPLRILFAGSLIVPFDQLEAAYEEVHPHVDVQMEGHGSIQVMRHVTEIHDLVDVTVTADHALIPLLMYATNDPDTGLPYADWYIEFATNRLTLAYTDQSAYADEVTADNWYEVIPRQGVRLGLPDPRFDAAGYRGLMALQLAELYYDDALIFEDFTMGRFQTGLLTREEEGCWAIHVPEVVQPKPDSGIVVRGGSIQLIALLESGDVDYAFEYESVSRQHGFRYVPLPEAIHMGTETQAERYGQVEVHLDFQRFASVAPVFRGEWIGYGVTIPSNAPHREEAEEFVAFLLGPDGQRIMEANHHPLILPARADGYERVPERLQGQCVPTP